MSFKKIGFLNPKKTCFFLCDVQEKLRFMDYFKEFSKNVEKLVKAGKILDIPLIVTEHNSEKSGKTISELDIKHAKGIFDKTKFSMYIPEVQKFLENEKHIESIVVFGMETHVCIDQTCLDLLNTNKYEVHVIADCVLSRSTIDRDFALERLRTAGCYILTSENVMFKLLRDETHPKFEEFRDLVIEQTHNTGFK
ncbi:hypothetical protein PVAND_002341 [Polypedilum vanderplanki]|uniref:Isochorismatase domain-containing protein 1 n=1 Tax=Polypedilum vanderplanki TaxID=319348 RepID=A0A9J6BQX8_POLVA|nr:hypothetical protein PVAND_002341 [Polypedilum vanderplanki]